MQVKECTEEGTGRAKGWSGNDLGVMEEAPSWNLEEEMA